MFKRPGIRKHVILKQCNDLFRETTHDVFDTINMFPTILFRSQIVLTPLYFRIVKENYFRIIQCLFVLKAYLKMYF